MYVSTFFNFIFHDIKCNINFYCYLFPFPYLVENVFTGAWEIFVLEFISIFKCHVSLAFSSTGKDQQGYWHGIMPVVHCHVHPQAF